MSPLPWCGELRPLIALALPVALSRAGLLVMTTVNTVMTGWAGAQELACLALGLAPFILLMLIGTGLLTGTVVLVAQAHGAGEAASCGRIWRTALREALLVGAVGTALLWGAGPFLALMGQDPALVDGAAEVAWMLGLGMPAMLGYVATTLTLEGLGYPRAGVAVIVAGNVINLVLNDLLIFGHLGMPALGAAGAALATTLARWAMLAMIVGYALLWQPLRAYGLLGPWRAEPALRRKLWRLGLPFAISQGLETSAFQGLTLLCGWLGTTALAAYQIALNVSALVYMATVGLATATAVRVGYGIGAGEPRRAVAAAWLGLAVTLCVMLSLAPVIALGGGEIAAGYNSDPRVLELARHGFLVVALIIVADGAQGVMTGALRGAGDVLWPMAVHVLSFWLVLLPAAWLFAFPLGGGMQGLLAGIVAGLAVATVLLLVRLSGLHRRRLGRV